MTVGARCSDCLKCRGFAAGPSASAGKCPASHKAFRNGILTRPAAQMHVKTLEGAWDRGQRDLGRPTGGSALADFACSIVRLPYRPSASARLLDWGQLAVVGCACVSDEGGRRLALQHGRKPSELVY